MIDWDRDIDAMLAPFAEPMTFNGSTVDAVVDVEDGQMLAEGARHIVGRNISATVRDSAVPGIKIGSPVTLRSANWKVRDFTRESDGRVVVLFLEKTA